jgi:hypothetical protein
LKKKRRKLKKKKKKKKKKKRGGRSHPLPKNGVAGPPHFWPYGGGRSHPRPLGVVRPPRKAKKKKKKGKMGFGLWGWPDHSQRPGVASATPIRPVWGGRSHPLAKNGVVRPPPKSQTIFRFFFFFGLSGWPDHPQRPGVASATPIWPYGGWPYGVAEATPWLRPPGFFGQGVASATRFFFFFFFYNFLLFFQKKKNLKPKMPKTMPFWAKRRSFGVKGSLDILLLKGS